MCSCCKMGPSDVKIMRQRQGAVEIEDFDDEVKYRHPKRRAKKSRRRSETRAPCPEAEDGKHVYVWEPYVSDFSPRDRVFYNHFGYHRHEILTCCGCLTVKGYGRDTERYTKVKERKWRKLTGGEYNIKRGEPIGRWRRWGGTYGNFKWEDYDEGYQQALVEWESSAAARQMENLAAIRRIEFRRRLLGYTS